MLFLILNPSSEHMLRWQCNNFKDPGVQLYGGTLFRHVNYIFDACCACDCFSLRHLRDEVDDIFCKLPPPTPSIQPRSYSISSAVSSVAFVIIAACQARLNHCVVSLRLVRLQAWPFTTILKISASLALLWYQCQMVISTFFSWILRGKKVKCLFRIGQVDCSFAKGRQGYEWLVSLCLRDLSNFKGLNYDGVFSKGRSRYDSMHCRNENSLWFCEPCPRWAWIRSHALAPYQGFGWLVALSVRGDLRPEIFARIWRVNGLKVFCRFRMLRSWCAIRCTV